MTDKILLVGNIGKPYEYKRRWAYRHLQLVKKGTYLTDLTVPTKVKKVIFS